MPILWPTELKSSSILESLAGIAQIEGGRREGGEAMNSALSRLNVLATFVVLLLGILCAAASFLDAFNSPSVHANVQVVKINRFRRQLSGNDEVLLTLNVSVDVQPAFTWNTKQIFVFIAAEYETKKNSLNQISLWDQIILDKEHAKFQTKISSKYPLIDQGTHLRGKSVDLVLHWHAMPITGRMILGKLPVSSFELPDSYT